MINPNILTSYFFYSSIGLIFLGVLFYLFHYRFISRKRSFLSYPINIQIRTILSISLMSAVTISVVFIFSKFTSILAVPSARVAFEGVLVKLSGFLFGPIVGIISAIVTEIVILFFVPVYFHYKFLLVLISFGAFAGLLRVFIFSRTKLHHLLLLTYLGAFFFFGLTLFFFYATLGEGVGLNLVSWKQLFTNFKNKYLTFNLQAIGFYANLLIFLLIFIFLIWATIYLYSGGKGWKWIKKKTLRTILPVLILTLFSEYFISVIISTNANSEVFGQSSQSHFVLFISALTIAPIKILFNTIIIYSVWKIFRHYFDRKILQN